MVCGIEVGSSWSQGGDVLSAESEEELEEGEEFDRWSASTGGRRTSGVECRVVPSWCSGEAGAS